MRKIRERGIEKQRDEEEATSISHLHSQQPPFSSLSFGSAQFQRPNWHYHPNNWNGRTIISPSSWFLNPKKQKNGKIIKVSQPRILGPVENKDVTLVIDNCLPKPLTTPYHSPSFQISPTSPFSSLAKEKKYILRK